VFDRDTIGTPSIFKVIRSAAALVRIASGVLLIIRVKRELMIVYRNGCRYDERLNTETGGSKRPRVHWVVWVNIQ
jgi:hypothetical protein